MPIYEYQCMECGHHLEALQKMSDEELSLCPRCDQPRLSKLVSAAGLQFKGTGWYLTDYANKNTQDKSASPDNKTKDD